MKLRNAITAILAFFAFSICTAQISISVQVTNATCSSNGSIQVNATGGTGTLSYELSSTCLPVPLVQQASLFNNLLPCQYTITVTDGGTGASATQTAVVAGNYQSPSLSLFCGSCNIETAVSGGLAPLTFSISATGLNGAYTLNTPPNSPIFNNIQSATSYWVKVTDACGNITVETCQTGEGSLFDFTYEIGIDGLLHVTSVTGGVGALMYILNSDNGSFTNSTGVFPQIQWGCGMTLSVGDGCTTISKSISLRPSVLSICSNFAEGTASFGQVVNGIPPFTYNYVPQSGVGISTTNSLMTGLPINAGAYIFQVVDACGNTSDAIFKFKKYPIFEQDPAATCAENSISLYTPTEGCSGGFDADSWPFEVTCLTCSPVENGTVDTAGVSITFTGNTPGNWEFAVEDGCLDQMVCRDSVVLHIESYCDSLKARLIDRFVCDNGAISDRAMSTENGVFKLYDAADNLLETNTTGVFFVQDSGAYKVTLSIPGCGDYVGGADIGFWEPVDPLFYTYIYNGVVNGSCKTQYQLVLDPSTGPFYLTGGPDNIFMLLDINQLTNNCQFYSITGLLPGDYQLAEVDHCGVKNIHLPAPNFDLEAIPFGNCPGSGTITVTGAMNQPEWVAWGAANNAEITWPETITDTYGLDSDSGGSITTQSGSPFTFVNVDAGTHTVYLYTLNSPCPVDTAIIYVPEADTLDFAVTSGLLCDGNATTALGFEILSGKPPYIIEQVDCSNPNTVLASFNVVDSTLSLPGFPIGDYCFRLVDSCITSLDHQFSVQYFQDDIELAFNCDNTITLSVDSLNASYTWLDGLGNILGNGHKINLPNPVVAAYFAVKVDIGECIINRSIAVPATEIVPTLAIQGEPYFCENDTAMLAAVSQGNVFNWSNGAQTQSIETSLPGIYTATVTNGLGCTATASFELTLDIPSVAIQVMSGGNGYGLRCFQDSNGVLLANPIAGIPPFSFNWSNLETTPHITQLKTGEYFVTITDAIGCQDTVAAVLTEPDLFVPEIDHLAPLCFGFNDGFIEIAGWSGGVGGVKASLLGSAPQFAPVLFDNLAPGGFSLEVFDANGCTVRDSFLFSQPNELYLELGDDLIVELGDSVYLDPQVSFAPIDSFLWRSNDPTPMPDLATWCKPVDNAYYALTVWDENGCSVDDKVNIRVTKEIDIYVPNAFSPNGDGFNDFFTVYARTSSVKRILRFQIYDRFGEQLFVKTDFEPNVEQLGWDGTLDGKPLNPNVFAWKAEVEFIDGRIELLYGDLVLMR